MPTYEILKLERTILAYYVEADTWQEAKRLGDEGSDDTLGEPEEELLGNDGVYSVRNMDTDTLEYEGA